MNARIRSLIASATAAGLVLAVAPAALAVGLPPHHHDLPVAAGNGPGLQVQPLSLPAPSYNVSTDRQLAAALKSAQPGQVIHLQSGATFSTIDDRAVRSGWVTVSGAGDAVAPQIYGADLYGSHYLRFTNVEFTHKLYIAANAMHTAPSANIQVLNSEVTCGATQTYPMHTGIMVRQGAQNVTFAGDYVHNCTLGFTTIAQDNPTQNLVLVHNLFQDFSGDAIDIGGNNNTTIADNVIQDIQRSPGSGWHDDGIQFLGNTADTLIQNNVLDNSEDQLVFVQDAVKGIQTGRQTNTNVLVDHNLIYGAGAAAVQDEGAINGQFIDNTVWDANDGAFILRKSGYTGTAPHTTTMQGNILESYIQVGAPGSESDDMIQTVSKWTQKQLSSTDIVGVAPGFVNAAQGDFALVPGSPGSGSSATANPPVNTPVGTISAPSPGIALGADPANYPYGAPQFGTGS